MQEKKTQTRGIPIDADYVLSVDLLCFFIQKNGTEAELTDLTVEADIDCLEFSNLCLERFFLGLQPVTKFNFKNWPSFNKKISSFHLLAIFSLEMTF